MKFTFLAISTAALMSTSVLATPSAFDYNNDTVTVDLAGEVVARCAMNAAGGGDSITKSDLDLTKDMNDVEQSIGTVKVWCNDGTGKAKVETSSANNGKLVNADGITTIDYVFRFHGNTTNSPGHSAPHNYYSLEAPVGELINVWAAGLNPVNAPFDPQSTNPAPKNLYIKTQGLTGQELAGIYTDTITLKISPQM